MTNQDFINQAVFLQAHYQEPKPPYGGSNISTCFVIYAPSADERTDYLYQLGEEASFQWSANLSATYVVGQQDGLWGKLRFGAYQLTDGAYRELFSDRPVKFVQATGINENSMVYGRPCLNIVVEFSKTDFDPPAGSSRYESYWDEADSFIVDDLGDTIRITITDATKPYSRLSSRTFQANFVGFEKDAGNGGYGTSVQLPAYSFLKQDSAYVENRAKNVKQNTFGQNQTGLFVAYDFSQTKITNTSGAVVTVSNVPEGVYLGQNIEGLNLQFDTSSIKWLEDGVYMSAKITSDNVEGWSQMTSWTWEINYKNNNISVSPVWQMVSLNDTYTLAPEGVTPTVSGTSAADSSVDFTLRGEDEIRQYIALCGGAINAAYGKEVVRVQQEDIALTSTVDQYNSTFTQHFKVRKTNSLTPEPKLDQSTIVPIKFVNGQTASIAESLFADSSFTYTYYSYSAESSDTEPTESTKSGTIPNDQLSTISFAYKEASASGEEVFIEDNFLVGNFPDDGPASYIIRGVANVAGNNVSGEWGATLEKYGPIAFMATGTDTNRYIAGVDTNIFKVPTVSFNVQYNDSSTAEISASEVTYKVGDYQLQVGQRIDWSRISAYVSGSSDPRILSVACIATDPQMGQQVQTAISLFFEVNSVQGLACVAGTNPKLGNTWHDLRTSGGVKLKATFKNGLVQELTSDQWLFADVENDMVMVAPTQDQPQKVNLASSISAASSLETSIDFSSAGWEAPAIKSFDIASEALRSDFTNRVDKIDLTQVKGTVSYEGATYTGQVSFDSGSASGNPKVYTAAMEKTDGTPIEVDLTGGSPLEVLMEDNAVVMSARFVFTVTSQFDTAQTAEFKRPLTIYDINNIAAIKVVSHKSEYVVGDTFMGEGDDTSVIVYYHDGTDSGTLNTAQINLKDGWRTLTISPAIGETLSTIGTIEVRISSIFDSSVYGSYTIKVVPKNASTMPQSLSLAVVRMSGNTTDPKGNLILCNTITSAGTKVIFGLVDITKTQVVNGVRQVLPSFNSATDFYGYITDICDPDKQARVVLFKDFVPPVDGQANITCKFPVWQEGNADLINGCRFGALFGNANARNRLFVSGNPSRPNTDWYSGKSDDSSSGGFGYFEDTSYCNYGTDATPVVGYQVVSDDTLAVFKSRSVQEPCLYFRTSTLVTAVDAAGNTKTDASGATLKMEAFTLTVANAGAGALAPQLFTTLNGDSLFISGEKKICGLDSIGPIGTSKRAFSSRSVLIDPAVEKEDFTDSALFSDNTFLYLACPDGMWVTQYQSYSSETGQYEWWHFDIDGVTAFGLLGDKVIMGDSKGRLLLKDSSAYSDVDKIYPNALHLAGAEGEDSDYLSTSKQTLQEAVEKLETGGYSQLRLKIVATDLGDIYERVAMVGNNPETDQLIVDPTGKYLMVSDNFGAEMAKQISDLETYKLFLTQYAGTSLSARNTVKLKIIPDDDTYHYTRIQIYTLDGKPVEYLGAYFSGQLLRDLEGTYPVINPDTSTGIFQLAGRLTEEDPDNPGRYIHPLDLVMFSSTAVSYKFQKELRISLGSMIESEFQLLKAVKAWYLTSPFTLGPISYRKTVWSWTLTADTGEDSELEVGRAVNSVDYEKMINAIPFTAVTSDEPTSPSNISFRQVSFSKEVVPKVYTLSAQSWNIPFICFGFRSGSAEPSVLSTIEIVYSVPVTGAGRGNR